MEKCNIEYMLRNAFLSIALLNCLWHWRSALATFHGIILKDRKIIYDYHAVVTAAVMHYVSVCFVSSAVTVRSLVMILWKADASNYHLPGLMFTSSKNICVVFGMLLDMFLYDFHFFYFWKLENNSYIFCFFRIFYLLYQFHLLEIFFLMGIIPYKHVIF